MTHHNESQQQQSNQGRSAGQSMGGSNNIECNVNQGGGMYELTIGVQGATPVFTQKFTNDQQLTKYISDHNLNVPGWSGKSSPTSPSSGQQNVQR